MPAERRSIISNYVDIVQKLTFDGFQNEDVRLLQFRLVLSRVRLVFSELLEVLLRRGDKFTTVDGEATALRIHKDVHAFRRGGGIRKDRVRLTLVHPAVVRGVVSVMVVARVRMRRRVNPTLIHRLLLDLLCGSHVIASSRGSAAYPLILLLQCMLLLLNGLVFVARMLPV